jgi:hypothetical protein
MSILPEYLNPKQPQKTKNVHNEKDHQEKKLDEISRTVLALKLTRLSIF